MSGRFLRNSANPVGQSAGRAKRKSVEILNVRFSLLSDRRLKPRVSIFQDRSDSELTEATVAVTKGEMRSADWHGKHIRGSLSDAEKELDHLAADVAKYR